MLDKKSMTGTSLSSPLLKAWLKDSLFKKSDVNWISEEPKRFLSTGEGVFLLLIFLRLLIGQFISTLGFVLGFHHYQGRAFFMIDRS
jgi:hypothetical protein